MNTKLGQFILQSNREAAAGVASQTDVVPREARRPQQHIEVGRRAEKVHEVGRRWRTPDSSFSLNVSALSWLIKYVYIFLLILHDIRNFLIWLVLF
jgi:hypothetical protein